MRRMGDCDDRMSEVWLLVVGIFAIDREVTGDICQKYGLEWCCS